jgi:hypothetical protein
MERITKTLSLEDWIAETIQELADKEKRSFTRQVEVLLEAALERQKQPETVEMNTPERNEHTERRD